MIFRMVQKSERILPFCHNARVRQTDRRAEFSSLDRVCIACSAVKTSTVNSRVSLDREQGRVMCTGLYLH